MGGTEIVPVAPRRMRCTLPELPPSVNQIYGPSLSIYSATPRWEIKGEWKLWKSRAKKYVQACEWAKDAFLKLTLDFHSPDWYYKNGKLKRIDVQNLEKLAIDAVFEKIECDDSRIVEKISRKLTGPRAMVVITIEEIIEGDFCGSSAGSKI